MNNTIEKRNVLALNGKWCKGCIIFTEDIEKEDGGSHAHNIVV